MKLFKTVFTAAARRPRLTACALGLVILALSAVCLAGIYSDDGMPDRTKRVFIYIIFAFIIVETLWLTWGAALLQVVSSEGEHRLLKIQLYIPSFIGLAAGVFFVSCSAVFEEKFFPLREYQVWGLVALVSGLAALKCARLIDVGITTGRFREMLLAAEPEKKRCQEKAEENGARKPDRSAP